MATLSGMVVENKAPVYDYKWLCQMMQDRLRVTIVLRDPVGARIMGTINGIRPEDGSGKSWLVTVCDGTVYNEVYVRAV